MSYPSLSEIEAARERLGDLVRETPVWNWQSPALEAIVGDTEVHLKLELLQYGGTFKPRGALTNMLALDQDTLARGVAAVSAGNHAMATAHAARALHTTAKVVMPANAAPFRVAACRKLGAEVVLMPDVHQAFAETQRIEREEGRTFIHPFDGELTTLGTATLGLEFARQVSDLDAVVIPIGGGGLIAGVACAFKQVQPSCRVIGVEPAGADSMHRSWAAGEPQSIDSVRTIADSLGAPYAKPYSFAMCREFTDQLVMIDDDQIRLAMRLLFEDMKLAVEPAGAATTAALCGPLREQLAGKRVGLIVCGANTGPETFYQQTAR